MYEYEFIKKIVEEVSKRIDHRALPIAKYPVGLKSRVKDVISQLDLGCDKEATPYNYKMTKSKVRKTPLCITILPCNLASSSSFFLFLSISSLIELVNTMTSSSI